MAPNRTYPVSLLFEGPLFSDELKYKPQQSSIDQEFETLRLVPSKSAASGVYTIYFLPEHRQWALVRLAERYRGLFEIELHRGMSGEYQLLRQGFTSDDLDFLFDIVPKPAKEYSPVVYDMLWLVATYDEYFTLTEAMVDRDEFTPRQILQTMDSEVHQNEGFFRRFLRSHLIRPVSDDSEYVRSRSNRSKTKISVDLDEVHEITAEGKEALQGIISEYDRIFQQRQFDPLLINSELDPVDHIKQFDSESTDPTTEISFDKMQDDDGILGEIAASFVAEDDQFDEISDEPKTTSETADAESTDESVPSPEESIQTEFSTSDDTLEQQKLVTSYLKNDTDNEGTQENTEEPFVGEFTREDVLQATVAAAELIIDHAYIRTSKVKEAVWESVDCPDDSKSTLWEAVSGVLLAMNVVQGRENGYIWCATASSQAQ
jgi:hypothetical protein